MSNWILNLFLLLLLMLSSITGSLADDDHMEARRLVETGSILPFEQILDTVQKRWRGRILEVELERKRGAYVYEIELLDEQGSVWEMKIDAATGKFLKTEQED